MHNNRLRTLTTLLLVLTSCNSKFIYPLKGGKLLTNTTMSEKYNKGLIFIAPRNTLKVRSVEACRVERVFVGSDSAIIVLTKGQLVGAYGNLHKCYVSSGTVITKGQIIGELYSKDEVGDNSLQVSFKKDDKSFIPNW